MKQEEAPETVEVLPSASVLLESMRAIGYSMQAAVADVIDNSIVAGASQIDILSDTDSAMPAIGVLDDGCGMSDDELINAMRFGSKSPLDARSEYDLGRFGLGLKTASFSQCRCLTVVTRKNGQTSTASWDLDTVAEHDRWLVKKANVASIPWADRIVGSGTLILWQKLGRQSDKRNLDTHRRDLVRQVAETATHVERVFHRFLSGENRSQKLKISVNGRELQAFDPFHSHHPATIQGPEETFRLGEQTIRIQPYTLPHHKKVSLEDWKKYEGTEGYNRNQGFYVYRGNRLIIYGTWFGLAKQSELTKLSRVKIDIPNTLDVDWKIDIKKASAQPPHAVRDRLRRIIEEIVARSKRIYTSRGRRLVGDNPVPVWNRIQNKNLIFYSLDSEHPAFAEFNARLDKRQQREFGNLLALINATIPIDAIFSDAGASPKSISVQPLTGDSFTELVKSTYSCLKKNGLSHDKIKLAMLAAPPFNDNCSLAETIIEEIMKTEGDHDH